MENKSTSLGEKIFDEFKAGNPLFILMALFVGFLLLATWVWQTVTTPLIIATPRFSHPTAAYILTLTAQAQHGQVAPPSTPVPVGTPRAALFYYDQMVNLDS